MIVGHRAVQGEVMLAELRVFGEQGLGLDLVGHVLANYKTIISRASSRLFK